MLVQQFNEFVRDTYGTVEFIPLHAPQFQGRELEYVGNTIKSTFVSSVGAYVDQFEDVLREYTGATRVAAVVNGTAALHVALKMAGVEAGDYVITQSLTFVATCNALYHMGAHPIFVDVSRKSMGLCPRSLQNYLDDNAVVDDDGCRLKLSGARIKAVVPMHTFGHPVELDELQVVCDAWGITLVEDVAESLGSFYKGRHTGTFGRFAAMSFNGNKVITTGGGGAVFSKIEEEGAHVKHLTTTAKVPHPYEFFHDEAGFNYRLPNINAALGCAQMEVLESYLKLKRNLANAYRQFFDATDFTFFVEPEYAKSNYWLNAVLCPDATSREAFINETNSNGVMTRPIWRLMHTLPMYAECLRGDLTNSEYFESIVVNIPSTPILSENV